ncbi:MAG: LEPR-XLL domain-containing protein, partial [Desulfobacteraceae bacterium]
MGLARQIRRLRKRKEATAAKKRRKALIEPLEPRILLSADIEPEAGQVISTGLNALADWADELDTFDELGQSLPIVDQSIGEVLDVGGILRDHLADAVETYFEDPDPSTPGVVETATTDGLNVALRDLDVTAGGLSITVDDATVEGDLYTTPDGEELRFHLILEATRTTDVDMDLGSEAEAAGLYLDSPSSVPLETSIIFDFSFGVDLSDGSVDEGDFFIRPQSMTLGANVDAQALDFTMGYGFLELVVEDGDLGLDAGIAVDFVNPDADTQGNITIQEFEDTPVDDLVEVTATGEASAVLPVEADYLPFSVGGNPTIIITDTNLFDTTAPAVAFNADFDAIEQFNIDAEQAMRAGFDALADLGDDVDGGNELGTQLPFLNTSLGQVMDLGGFLAEILVDPLSALLEGEEGVSPDDLMAAIEGALLNKGASIENLTHAFENNVHSFNLAFQAEERETLTLQFSDELSIIGLALEGEFTLDLMVDFGLNLTLGVDLSMLPALGDAFFVQLHERPGGTPTLEARLEVPTGSLSARLGILDVEAALTQASLLAALTLGMTDPNGDGRTSLNEILGTPSQD